MNIVITNDAVDIAGGENYTLYLAQGLKEEGHNIIICPLENSMLGEESIKLGFETIPLPYSTGGKNFLRSIKLMRSCLKDKKIDIIHSTANSDRTISAFVSKKIRCKNIASVNSCYSISHNIVHRYRNKYLISHFITAGHSSKKLLTGKDKIPEDKVTVIHIGIPDNTSSFTGEKRSISRNKLNIGNDDTVIGVIARLVDFKGINILIDAIKFISEKDFTDKIKLLIVGDGILRSELEIQTEKLKLKNKIIFTGHQKDLDNYLSAMDIYTQPSLEMNAELCPLSTLLAKSAGLPLVVSDSGDLKYIVNDNSDGFIIAPGNSEKLADKLSYLILNEEIRKQMGIKSRENYRKYYTLKTMIQKVLSVYEKVLNI